MALFFSQKRFDLPRFIRRCRRFDPFELAKYGELVSYLKENAATVHPRPLGVKLIVISDTHGCLANDEAQYAAFAAFVSGIKAYDLCVLLGDITAPDLQKITALLDPEKMLGILGNHDAFDLYRQYGIRNLTAGRVYPLDGTDIRFGCIGGSFRYKDEAFPAYTQAESLQLAAAMEPPFDVLLSHDIAFDDPRRHPSHIGLAGNTYCVYHYAVPYHIHGHMHKTYEARYPNGTVEKCVYRWEFMKL